MKSTRQKPPLIWPFILAFLFVLSTVLLLWHFYNRYQRDRIIREKELELSAIADLKVSQIESWRKERIGVANTLLDNTLFTKQLTEYIDFPSKDREDELLKWMTSMTINYDYRSILLADNEANVKLAVNAADSLVGDYMRSFLPQLEKTHKVILTDLHLTDKIYFIHLDLIIPLINVIGIDTITKGFILIRIDPEKILFPIVKTWPTPGKTSETLLLRREGDSVLYLNELRHRISTALSLKLSIDSTLPAARAATGFVGTMSGIDYRGVPVLAATRKIEDSNWYLISKTDEAELFEELNQDMFLIKIIISLFILTIGSVIALFWRHQKARYYRAKYETELDRMALVKHFDYILKYANDIIFLVDSDLRIVEANDRALEVYMYRRNEFIGIRLKDLRAPETAGLLAQQIELIESKEFATYETIHRRKDESVFHIEISARVVNIEGTKYYQTIGRDITERKLIQETLKESEEKFRKIFEGSPIGMLMTGRDFGIVRSNLAFTKMIGYSEEELINLSFRHFTHPEDLNNEEVSILRLIASEIPNYRTEKRYIRKDQTIIWGSTTVSIIRNNNGEMQYFLTMVEDISARREAEVEIIAAKVKAEESDKLKTAFLHNVSHEIRTPMNAIMGFSTLLNDMNQNVPECRQYTDVIFQSANQLLSIINDIVDIANIESGQVKLNLKPVNLNSSLNVLNEQFRYDNETLRDVNLVLRTTLPDEDSILITDNTKLIQILTNLINNAIKFTKTGTIEFGYIVKDECFEFYVKDTGIGIPLEFHSKIFDRFYQVYNSGSRQYGGTGLGLSICKAYVELLGGKIWLSSGEEKGTHFFFTIPFRKPVEAIS